MDLTTLNCLNARAKIGHSFSGSIYQIYKAGAGHYINIVKILNSLRNRNSRMLYLHAVSRRIPISPRIKYLVHPTLFGSDFIGKLSVSLSTLDLRCLYPASNLLPKWLHWFRDVVHGPLYEFHLCRIPEMNYHDFMHHINYPYIRLYIYRQIWYQTILLYTVLYFISGAFKA